MEGKQKQALSVRCPTCGAKPERSVSLAPANPAQSRIEIGAWDLTTSTS